ncbi:hypothetical protein DFAR_360011 [Desulfarculales bacterium]
MGQAGFAICGERHTSAALFVQRLHRRRGRYAVKVLGDSDRVKVLGDSDRIIITLTNLGAKGGLPRVEKVALVASLCERKEAGRLLAEAGSFVDSARNIVILHVHYSQYVYYPGNVLEDRALSVLRQELIHPQTGRTLELDVLNWPCWACGPRSPLGVQRHRAWRVPRFHRLPGARARGGSWRHQKSAQMPGGLAQQAPPYRGRVLPRPFRARHAHPVLLLLG